MTKKDIKDVEVGKDVDVTIQPPKEALLGVKVRQLEATAASFSLRPSSSNSDGNYEACPKVIPGQDERHFRTV